MTKKQKEQMASDIARAFDGGEAWLDAAITKAGYIHPDQGIRQKDVSPIVSRKILKEWEDAGLEGVTVRGAKYYPVLNLVKFVMDRSIKWRAKKTSEVSKWAETEAEYKARERELKYKVQAGAYLDADEVRKVWAGHIGACRKRLLAIPRAMASRLQGETKRTVIEREIKAEIRSALEELSE